MLSSLPKGLSEKRPETLKPRAAQAAGGLGLGERSGRRQLWRPRGSHLLRASPEEELQGPAPSIRARSVGVWGFRGSWLWGGKCPTVASVEEAASEWQEGFCCFCCSPWSICHSGSGEF